MKLSDIFRKHRKHPVPDETPEPAEEESLITEETPAEAEEPVPPEPAEEPGPVPPGFVIGLTGGIASGKSAVRFFLEKKYRASTIDADVEGHRVLQSPEMLVELTKEFGTDILNEIGLVDRKKLGSIVFADPAKLSRLNEITHPAICREIARKVEDYRADRQKRPLLVLEAIELLRTPLVGLVDEVWVVDAPEDVRIERIMKRQGLTEEEAEERIARQMSAEEYAKRADWIIDGSGALPELYASLEKRLAGYR